tara:strand:+ start:133496 stop:134587 length:1092 start_codon:yes stop_codon:yes gene_type:complete
MSGVDWDGIEKAYDWFRDMKDVPQDAIWHSEGDVQIHTKAVVEAMIGLNEFQTLNDQDKHIMVVSALMHDIEKRSTTTTDFRYGRECIVAPRHAQRGEFTARNILYKDIETPYKIRERICKLIRFHGIPLWRDDETLGKTIIETSLYVNNNHLAMLAKADVLGRECVDKEELLEKVEYYKMMATELGVSSSRYVFKDRLHRFNYIGKNKPLEYLPYDDSKFGVYMMCGVAGSGKDRYASILLKSLPMVSLDAIRTEFKVKPTDKKGNGRVYQEAKERCKVLMRKHENFVFNATNIIADTRSRWTRLFEEYGGLVTIVYVEVPYDRLISQNANREDAVPVKIVEKMIRSLEIPTYDEAFDIIVA